MNKVQVKPEWANLGAGDTGIDIECVALCEAMNKFPGIKTFESCCGHGTDPYRVFFDAIDLHALTQIVYYFDSCYCGFYGWSVVVKTNYNMILGPSGAEAYEQAAKIAQIMSDYISKK
jgi:hypothetical protein